MSKYRPYAVECSAEESMENKVIFESEEEALEFYRMAGDDRVEFIKRLKEKGYIRKSAVEEAEEMYKQHMEIDGHCTRADDIKRWEENSCKAYSLIKQQHEAIQEQRKEIERLKNG